MIDYEAALREYKIGGVDAVQRIVGAALEGAALYREANDCQITKSHYLGEHGKPCLDCGAEQMWVLPATKEKQ